MAVPIDIEALLVRCYRDQRVDKALGSGGAARSSPGAFISDGYAPDCWPVIRNLQLGTRIDVSAKVASAPALEDAELVHAAVLSLGPHLGGLLMRQARAGEAPAVYAGWPGAVKVTISSVPSDRWNKHAKAWEPQIVWTDPHRNWGWCPVHVTPSAEEVELARRTYSVWHAALGQVRDALRRSKTRLARWYPTGPARPAEPWLV